MQPELFQEGLQIVGQSAGIRRVIEVIEKAARGRWPVLILGETGTGKELVARAIHRASGGGPFVVIDCSALVGPLAESELFGHVKGAFTGAIASKPGLFALAHGGTAFLDEVGELPLEIQAKLLRVLQEKEFRPVGSTSPRKSDFRIVAATNRDLAAEVEKGTFRRDLYYRLNVIRIRLAPLRERKEDIPLLVDHFLRRYGRGHRLTREALEALLAYDWPGNVRELENCIQQLVALHSGPLIHVEHLPSPIQNFLASRRPRTVAAAAAIGSTRGQGHLARSPGAPGPPPTLAELEKQAILQALEYTKGDRAEAAALLGIGRTTLYRKLKEYRCEQLELFDSSRPPER